MAESSRPQGNRGQMPKPEGFQSEVVPSVAVPVHSDAEGPSIDLKEPEQHVVKAVGDSGTNFTVSVPASHSVEVIATRPGFIYNQRKMPGDRFKVSDMSQVGEWMVLADPVAESERQKAIMIAKLKPART